MSFGTPYSLAPVFTVNQHTTLTFNFGGLVSVGDRVTLFLSAYAPGVNLFTVTDNYANVWNPDESAVISYVGLWAVSSLIAHTGSGFVATATFAVSDYLSGIGMGVTPSVAPTADGAVAGTGLAGTITPGNLQTLGNNDLILFAVTSQNNGQVWTPSTGFTILQNYTGAGNQGCPILLSLYNPTNAAGTITPVITASPGGKWATIALGFATQYLPLIISVTPSNLLAPNGGPVTVAIAGQMTSFNSGSTVTIQNSVVGTTTAVAGTWTALSATSATLDITVGPGVGSFTITIDGIVSHAVSTAAQPFAINALVSCNGVLTFIFTQPNSPALQAITSPPTPPTISVDGSPVSLGPATGTLTTPDAAMVMFRPATAILPGQVVTYSAATGAFATALGSSLQVVDLPVSNQVATANTYPLEQAVGTWGGFDVVRTMLWGVNYGAEPSTTTSEKFPALDGMKRSGFQQNQSWRYNGAAVPGGYDANGYPISWPAGGTITTWIAQGGGPNGVDAMGLPIQTGTYTLLLRDPAGDKSFALTGNGASVAIGAPAVATLPDGRTQITWMVTYLSSPSTYQPSLVLSMTSISGLYQPPGSPWPNIALRLPADVGNTDQSNRFAPSALAVARMRTALGNAVASARMMDWDGFANWSGYVQPSDLLNPDAATWFSNQVFIAPGTWSIVLWDTSSGNTAVYGPQTGLFPEGPDGFGNYCTLLASDGGSVAFPAEGNAQQWCVLELTSTQPHGFVHGRPLTSSGTTKPQLILSGVQTFALTQAAISGTTVTYTGTIVDGASNFLVGMSVTVSGFTNAGNNGTFTVTGSTATTLVVANALGVNETHAATVSMQVPFSPGGAYLNASIPWIIDSYSIGVAEFCGGSAPSSSAVLTVNPGAGPYAVDWTLGQAVPKNNASVPKAVQPYLCAAAGSKTAVYVNLPLFGSPACHAAIADQQAPGLAIGAIVYAELGDEPWNPATSNPDHNELRSVAHLVQGGQVGDSFFGGRYVITSGNVGNQLPDWETAYVLMAAHAFDAYKAELIALGRSDVTVRCLLGSWWTSPATTSALCAAIVAYGLQDYFYGIATAPYMSIANDPTIQAAFNPASGNWPVPQLVDLNRFYRHTSTIEQGFFSGHEAAIVAAGLDLVMVAYECALNYPVPSGLSGTYYSQLVQDMVSHPAAWQDFTSFGITLQVGCVTVPNSGFVLAHYFTLLGAQAIAGSAGAGQYFIYAGLTQAPGYGLAGQSYATAQGGSPGNGKSFYTSNASVYGQALNDWTDATAPPSITGPIDIDAMAGSLIIV